MSLKSYALTTVSRAKDFMDLSDLSSTEETVLENIVNSVTEYIENHCGRRFKQTTYTQEEYSGANSEYLVLDQYPIDSTATFTLEYRSSARNEDDWDTIDSEDYFVHWDEGIVELPEGGKFQDYAPLNYRVTYTAGYDFDNSSSYLSDTEAGDIEYVAWKLVASAWNKRRGGEDIEKESIGDYSVTYAKEVFENEELEAILDNYQREVLA